MFIFVYSDSRIKYINKSAVPYESLLNIRFISAYSAVDKISITSSTQPRRAACDHPLGFACVCGSVSNTGL